MIGRLLCWFGIHRYHTHKGKREWERECTRCPHREVAEFDVDGIHLLGWRRVS